MKLIIVLAILLSPTVVFGQTVNSSAVQLNRLDLDAFMAAGPAARRTFTLDYSIRIQEKWLSITAFGFEDFEPGNTRPFAFSMNAQNISFNKIPLGIQSEEGHTRGSGFWRAGPSLSITQTSLTARKIFKGLSVSYLPKMVGKISDHEIKVGFQTRNLSLGKYGYVYGQGLMRLRPKVADFYQPQAVYCPPKVGIYACVVIEVNRIRRTDMYFGVKINTLKLLRSL